MVFWYKKQEEKMCFCSFPFSMFPFFSGQEKRRKRDYVKKRERGGFFSSPSFRGREKKREGGRGGLFRGDRDKICY